MVSIEDMASFCKKKGFVFPSSEIYGGFSGFFDYGPLGSELFNNLKQSWWKHFVQNREDVVGIDGSIITHPMTWRASGHLESFGDLLLVCSKCKHKERADHFLEDKLDIVADGLEAQDVNDIVQKHKLTCPKCKGGFKEVNNFNLLFETKVGAKEGNKEVAYLRGETAQNIFMNFRQVADTSRLQLPFGIAQIGQCFRNEISARDFLFRTRELTIAELEYFLHPKEKKCPYLKKDYLNLEIQLLDDKTQEKGKKTIKKVKIKDIIKAKKIGEWHAYWLAHQYNWFLEIGLNPKNLKVREHMNVELSHYSSATFDIDYQFPFGSKEIAGNANRGQYDLKQHIKYSKKKLDIYDETTKEKVVPRVIEPTFGLGRIFLAVLYEAYQDDKKRGNIVLKMDTSLSPIKVAVFPLTNKVHENARKVFESIKEDFVCSYDKGGSVGRRYARADEQGIPYCVTKDFEDGVTIRDRDSTKQVRVSENELESVLRDLLKGKIAFKDLGPFVS
jgi:glycyl-tRNA synthetase